MTLEINIARVAGSGRVQGAMLIFVGLRASRYPSCRQAAIGTRSGPAGA